MASSAKVQLIKTKPLVQVLKTAFGDGAGAGWVTDDMDARAYDEIFADFTLVKQSAALLTLIFLASDPVRVGIAPDDFSDVHKVEGDGSVVQEILTVDVSGFAATQKFAIRVLTGGLSLLRIAAKVDDETSGPTLVLNAGVEFSSDWSGDAPKLQP